MIYFNKKLHLGLFYLSWISHIIHCNRIIPNCLVDQLHCEFRLILESQDLMVFINQTSIQTSSLQPAIFHPNGSVSLRDKRFCDIQHPIHQEEAVTIQAADGMTKQALLFNGTLPGPPIVVYRGQQVVVHVINTLLNEGVTVHWHGIRQRNTPWMDGVDGVSQCPINPGETFTYRFIAESAGTYWYHAHYGTQRTMGAHGPFIILDRDKEEPQKQRGGDDRLPNFTDEFYMVVSDLFKDNSEHVYYLVDNEAVSYFDGWDIPDNLCFNSTKQLDGVDCGVVRFQSGLINGKGYHYTENDVPKNTGIPLEKFTIKKGGKYRFRMICSSMTFAFRMSIDGHPLNIIASDGKLIKTKQVESVIISSGERYDFWIEADDPNKFGNYWIRAETLEMYQNGMPRKPNHVEAILHYDETADKSPISQRKECTASNPCIIMNCPYKIHRSDLNLQCINMDDLENTESYPDWEALETPQQTTDDFQEYFLNFHFTGLNHFWKTTVNGRRYRRPSAPPQIYPPKEKQQIFPCNNDSCTGELCRCTNIIEVSLGSIVQFVLFTTIQNPPGILNGNPHIIHLHGHTFHVVKVGYPTYDDATGFYKERNQDIHCLNDVKNCHNATWSNSSWLNGNLPGINSAPPLKDTVFVPVGGYTVIRFKADNPGYWYMHCHTEFHNEEGMALLIKVGEDSQMNPAPKEMSQCGDFHFTDKEFQQLYSNSIPFSTAVEELEIAEECNHQLQLYQIASVISGIAAVILLLSNTVLCCIFLKAKSTAGYVYIPSS